MLKRIRNFAVLVLIVIAISVLGITPTHAASSSHLSSISAKQSNYQPLKNTENKKLQPRDWGGGCSPKSPTQGNASVAFASYAACLSSGRMLGLYPVLLPDTYVNFGAANPGLWSSCTITIYVTDSNAGILQTNTFDCTSQARNSATNAYYRGDVCYCAVQGKGYFTEVGWSGVYAGKMYTGYNYFSPVQWIG